MACKELFQVYRLKDGEKDIAMNRVPKNLVMNYKPNAKQLQIIAVKLNVYLYARRNMIGKLANITKEAVTASD